MLTIKTHHGYTLDRFGIVHENAGKPVSEVRALVVDRACPGRIMVLSGESYLPVTDYMPLREAERVASLMNGESMAANVARKIDCDLGLMQFHALGQLGDDGELVDRVLPVG